MGSCAQHLRPEEWYCAGPSLRGTGDVWISGKSSLMHRSGKTGLYRQWIRRAVQTRVDADSRTAAAFCRLRDQWECETAHLSSVTKIILHPAYQRIIGLGPSVVPLLLRELEGEPRDWFWALSAITGQQPVPAEDAGNVRRMAEAWLTWGRAKNLI